MLNANKEQFQKEFSYRLKARMEYLELTQLELAKRSGLTQASISMHINGKVMPTAYTLAKLAKALIMSADDLIGHME